MLNEAVIKNAIKDIQAPIFLTFLETTPSTNDYFKGKPIPENNALEFCFTEEQTQGRGRRGRTWHSSPSTNIMMSCRWIIPEHLQNLNGLSSCVSLSLVAALKCLYSKEKTLNISMLQCKWPNDLFYQNKKLAGILIELQTDNGRLSEAIIGIGLNVNMADSDLIDQPWTSLQNILGHPQDRNAIAAALIRSLQTYLTRFTQKSYEDFQQEWQELDYLKGKSITLAVGQEKISGIACGVNISGHLLIETPDGRVVPCLAGEIVYI